ncbi:hypothetical protein C8Q70DRAFT_1018163, partial [Cubamyces menziesii]
LPPTRTVRARRASARPKQTRTVPPRRAGGRTRPAARGAATSSDEQRQQKARKASFMEKMKGEAKVLLGKIQGKHEKVEEGQRMKAGEAAPAGGKA